MNGTIAPVPDFYGYSIFCDDIRLEIDGKVTYVGAYTSGILLVKTDFPVTLPKFCVAIFFNQKKGLFKPSLRIQIYLPGDTDEKASIEAEVTAQEPPSIGNPENREYTMFGSNMVFAPFTIDQPGRIKVRILRDGVLHRMGNLRVLSISEAQQAARG
jgi:hypothetical protein